MKLYYSTHLFLQLPDIQDKRGHHDKDLRPGGWHEQEGQEEDIQLHVQHRPQGNHRDVTRSRILDVSPQVVIPNSGGSYGGGLAASALPMHGLGYGLPLSRLYARWAGGATSCWRSRWWLEEPLVAGGAAGSTSFSLPGISWGISSWPVSTGLGQTPTFTCRCPVRT